MKQAIRLLISRFRVRFPGGSLSNLPHQNSPICLTCGSELTDDNWALRCSSKSYYKCRICDNKERRLRYKNAREAAGFQVKPYRKEIPTCTQCGVKLTNDNWYEIYGKYRRYICIPCDRVKSKEINRQLRLEIIKAYGGKCVQCGINNPWLLDIDHINNDSYKDKKQGRVRSALYLWLKKNGYPKDNYQLLCKNCNWLKYLTSIGTISANSDTTRQNFPYSRFTNDLKSAHEITQGGRNENAGGSC